MMQFQLMLGADLLNSTYPTNHLLLAELLYLISNHTEIDV